MPVAVGEIRLRQVRPVLRFEILAKAGEIVPGEVTAMSGNGFDMSKLPQANGRGDVGHVEFATQHVDVQAIEAVAGNALQPVLLYQSYFFGRIEHQATAL